MRKSLIISLHININQCFGGSKESSHLDGSFEYLKHMFWMRNEKMKKVNKQCLLDTPRTVRVSEKTWQVIVRTRRP